MTDRPTDLARRAAARAHTLSDEHPKLAIRDLARGVRDLAAAVDAMTPPRADVVLPIDRAEGCATCGTEDVGRFDDPADDVCRDCRDEEKPGGPLDGTAGESLADGFARACCDAWNANARGGRIAASLLRATASEEDGLAERGEATLAPTVRAAMHHAADALGAPREDGPAACIACGDLLSPLDGPGTPQHVPTCAAHAARVTFAREARRFQAATADLASAWDHLLAEGDDGHGLAAYGLPWDFAEVAHAVAGWRIVDVPSTEYPDDEPTPSRFVTFSDPDDGSDVREG
jgi:hypothetical protein